MNLKCSFINVLSLKVWSKNIVNILLLFMQSHGNELHHGAEYYYCGRC